MFKIIKTSVLAGAALDWAAAKCAGVNPAYLRPHDFGLCRRAGNFRYSTNWTNGGPIIDKMQGLVQKTWLESSVETKCEAGLHNYDGDWISFGPTPLIAAMRCFVMSKLGDEVEIPEELL